jgi:ATP-dependent helicase/nuclease subunit A
MSRESRLQARHPGGSYLVQAPAGSGKTELLTQRILVLLAVADEPEEVLAITFTRKAAAEMRRRVMDALAMPRPEGEGEAHRLETWTLAQAVLARSDALGWNLGAHPARLSIHTIDGLAFSLARQLPLLSGFGEMPRPTEAAEPIYREAAETALREALHARQGAAEALLLHQDHNVAQVIRLLSGLLSCREQWLPHIARHGRRMDALRSRLEETLAELIREQIARCDALLPLEAKTRLPGLLAFAGRQLGEAGLTALGAWPEVSVEALPHWQSIAAQLLTKDGKLRRPGGVNVKSGFPKEFPAEKLAMQTLLGMLEGQDALVAELRGVAALPASACYDEEQWRVLESLFVLLLSAQTQLRRLFAQRGEADFTEIALRALEALGEMDETPSDLMLRLDYRIRHILVDEFQDTSDLQIRLLRRLTEGWSGSDGRTLFMVGDPMQSIYRFRKAEVGLFLRAAANQEQLPRVEPLLLERNFRSAPAIVGWVNRAFRHIFPASQDAVRGAVAHAPAEAALDHAGEVRLWLQQENDATAEAQAVLGLVQSARAEGKRVGILARARNHLHAIMDTLAAAGVPFRAVNVLPLDSRPEVRTLCALLRALLHPGDRLSWAALLRAPFCGLSTTDMHALLGGDQRPVWALLDDPERLQGLTEDARRRVGFLRQALAPVVAMRGRLPLRRLAEAGWLRLAAMGTLDHTARLNVEQALQLIEELDEGGHLAFELLEERLKRLYAMADSRPEAASVELLTMHGAKGLQWEVVILPGLGRRPANRDNPLLAWTEAPLQGGSQLLIAPKARTRGRDAVYALVQGIEKSKDDHELARLLYVACTRAETALHMFGQLPESGRAAAGSLLSLLLTEGRDDGFGAGITWMEPSTGARESRRRPLLRLQQPPAVPPLMPEATEGPVAGVPEREYGWAGPEAAPVGTALHAALQEVAQQGVESWTEADTMAAVMRMRRRLVADGLSGRMLDAASQRCERGLRQALDSERGRWVLSGGHAQAKAEWGLSLRHGGQVQQSVVDRTFVDAEGVRWIIDYKTAEHGGGELQDFIDRELTFHRPQLQRYARLLQAMEDRPVRLGLYFPMLDAWRAFAPEEDGPDGGPDDGSDEGI